MITKALYQALRFFATWLQQPTVIQVAGSVEISSSRSEDAK
jgi:hypothetical protein